MTKQNKPWKLSGVLALPLLMLSACEDEAAPEEAAVTGTGGEASGDVLGGTISDDMIAMDQLTSTSPPAERGATTAQERSSSDDQSGVESAAETPSDTGPVAGPEQSAAETETQPEPQPEPPETPAAPE